MPSAPTLLLRGKAGALVVQPSQAGGVRPDGSLRCSPVETRAEMSRDGRLLAVVETEGVRVIDMQTGADRMREPRPGVQALALSPMGTYLLTWEKLREEDDGNLRLWHVESGKTVLAFKQKILGEKSQWPAVQWSSDEKIACRLVTNEVHFFEANNEGIKPSCKLRVERVLQVALAPAGDQLHVATFVPELKSDPAVLRLWMYPDFGEGRFIASKQFFKASEGHMRWSPTGAGLLLQTHTEVDKSGKSYYGSSGLFHMNIAGVANQVKLSKEGPVHDVQWSPSGDEFCAVFGFAPSRAALYNATCVQTHDFGEAARNTVRWAPHGRSFILGGFGNLGGALSFWDRKTLKCLNTVDAHMTVVHEWSPDSRFFLTAILWPRLRVDNGYRLWSPSGKLLHKEDVSELSIAAWRPLLASDYSPPDDSYFVPAAPAAAAGRAGTPAKYVPPGARGAPVGGGGGGPGSGTSLSALAAAMETNGSSVMRTGLPPGASAGDDETSKNAAKNKAKREAAKKKKAAVDAAPVAASQSQAAADSAAAPTAEDEEMTEEKLEKKMRAVEKKIRQISELKELKAGGKTLEKNQLEKISNEEAVRKELEQLQLKIEEVKKSGMWR